MFKELLKLHGRDSDSYRTRLEDFNTECFSGILKMYNEIKDDFIYTFMKLPKDNYRVETQLRKSLPDTSNCIIDIAFIGEKNICLIESKVESKEGYEQLDRYGKVLDMHYNVNNKYLYYVTKYSDPKNQNNEYDKYKFKQFKWCEVANFLKKPSHIEIPLVKDYIQFLHHYGMEQENTLRKNNITTLHNMQKSVEIIEFHIKNSADQFDKIFNNVSPKWFFDYNHLYEHNRICNFKKHILQSSTGQYSEVLYSIEFENLVLSAHIYVNHEHEKINEFSELNTEEYNLEKVCYDHGVSIYIIDHLNKYINKEDSDKTIRNWFTNSFKKIKNLIDDNPTLGWNIT